MQAKVKIARYNRIVVIYDRISYASCLSIRGDDEPGLHLQV